MKFIYGKQDWKTLERGEENCYLLTNGLGGFSAMTMTGAVARNDHAVFMLWSSIFVTLMANKIGGLQFGIYRNCQISSRVFHTAVAALPLTKANRSDFE